MTRPLTKRKKTGELYTRPSMIEATIEVALEQDAATRHRRIQVTDRKSPEYLPSECLVHLFRDAKRRGDRDMMNSLALILLKRCEAILLSKIPDSKFPGAADLREEVLGEFGALLAEDGSGKNPDELDYFECRFNHAFKCFRIDIVRNEMNYIKGIAPLPTDSDENDPATDDQFAAWISEAFHSPAQENYILLQNAVDALPADEREAVVLRYMGYEVESKDPARKTVATICGVDGRTIRYRLSRAAAKLTEFKEGI